MAQKIGDFTPIKIQSIEGNLRDGLRIQNLFHPDFSLQNGEIILNWSALLRSKLHVKLLMVEGLHVNESLLKNSENSSQNTQLPLKEFQIDSLHVNIGELNYDAFTLESLILTGKNLYYKPKKAPRGKIDFDAKSSFGDIKADAFLDKIINASGLFFPKELPDGITLASPVAFEASGDTKKVAFALQTDSLGYDGLDFPILLANPQIFGNYDFASQSLMGDFSSPLNAAKATVKLDGKFSMKDNNFKTLNFNLEANTHINEQTLKELSASFDLPILETFSLNEPIFLQLDGNQSKANFILQIPHFVMDETSLESSKIQGHITLNSLQGSFASNLYAAQIPTSLEGNFRMNDFDADTFYFSIQGQSELNNYIDSTLFSQISGNLEKVDFISALKPTIYEDYKIDEMILKGSGDKERVIFSLQSLIRYGEESLHVKIPDANLTYGLSPLKLAINPQINLNNEPLIFIQDPQLLLTYEEDVLGVNLLSELIDLNATYNPDGKIKGALHVKGINPSDFITLPENIILKSISAQGNFNYDNSIDTNLEIFLDKTPLKLRANGTMEDLRATLWHESFEISASNLDTNAQATLKIQNIADFTKALNPHMNRDFPQILGAIDGKISLKDKELSFLIKSDSLAYEDQSLHKITAQGSFKEELFTLTRLNFNLDAGLGLSSMQSFSLIKPATFNTQTTHLNLDFKGLSLQATLKPQLSLHVNTDEFFLSHPLYGEGIISGILQANQEDENFRISGELNAKNIKAHYKPSGFSIHTDRDIIIVDNNASDKEDFFTQNIALDLALIIDDVHYKQDEIDLKTSGIFYLKKEPATLLEFYGSIIDITGNVVTLGKKFDILTSNIYFRGYNPVDPVLDILALYKHQETDITIRITGTQSNPRVYLSSNPLMSQRDIFSILVFGTRFGNGENPHTQQSRTSQASLFLVNELSKDYVKALGLDILMFEYNPNSGTIDTTIGKEITDETTLMLKNQSEGGAAIIQQKLSPRWKVELGIGSQSQSIDIIHKKKY